MTHINQLLAALPCYRPSEPVNGPPAKAVTILETVAAAKGGFNFLAYATYLLSKLYGPFYSSFMIEICVK